MSSLGKWFGFDKREVFEEAVAEFDGGHFEEAIDTFEAFLANDPEPEIGLQAQVYVGRSNGRLGQKQLALGNAVSALAFLRRALQILPEDAEIRRDFDHALREIANSPARAHEGARPVRRIG